MRTRVRPDGTPPKPERPARRSDVYLFAPAFALFVAAALIVAHTLITGR